MYDDLLAVRAGSFQHIVRQETFGDAAKGIGAALAVWHDLFGRSRGNVRINRQPFDRHIQRLHDSGAGLGRQAAGEDERAIVVVAEADFAALLLAALARQLLGFLAAAIRTHEALDVSRSAVLGDH